MSGPRRVSSRSELIEAAGSDTGEIVVTGDIDEVPQVRLAPGQSLNGVAESAIRFAARSDGVQLSADNKVSNLTLVTDPDRRALFNDTTFAGFGRSELTQLRLTGSLRILAEHAAFGGHLAGRNIHIEAADALGYAERPAGFGVEVVPGAFMLWNRQTDSRSIITAELLGIGVGKPGRPVSGGGIFVAGTPNGGRTIVSRLETGEVHSDGGIAPGTADRISGGVFVVSGAWVDAVRNRAAVTTYGPNDMVLDNWGSVETWQADAKITSIGPSAIGFVNFGRLRSLKVVAPIETFGAGARGFNVYDGSLDEAEFDRIVTRGDGAVGIQISRPVGRITVKRGIETFGGTGDSLVKGVVTQLPAVALSIKPGGTAREIIVDGGLLSHGDGIEAFELHGRIESLKVSAGFGSTGRGFESI